MVTIIILVVFEEHKVNEEHRAQEKHLVVHSRIRRELKDERISISEQLLRRSGPDLLNKTTRLRFCPQNIESDSTPHPPPSPLLLARAAGTGAELSPLTAVSVDGHNRHVLMVVDSELVAAASESVVHRTDQIIRAVINVQLRKEAAATHYVSQDLGRANLDT